MKKVLPLLLAFSLVILNVFGQDEQSLIEKLPPKKYMSDRYESPKGLPAAADSFDESIEDEQFMKEILVHKAKLFDGIDEKMAQSFTSFASAVSESDSLALVAFYNSTNGDSWTDNTNWLTGPVDTWFGITISSERVISIGLDQNNLSGSIPSQIGLLTELTYLSVWDNQIGGSIPAEIFGLVKLTYLTLWQNQFTGEIPDGIENLTQLQVLDMDGNQFTGTIPEEIGSLSNLMGLYLSFNQFSGTIPSTFGNLTNLDNLSLWNNQLTGEIPPELGNLTNLTVLLLLSNQLTGAIPPELGNLSNLTRLYLGDNQLTGSIPTVLGNLTSLDYLWLNNNQLTGAIPSELGNLSVLLQLFLDSNQLSGAIPPELANLSNLANLYLYNNELTGAIPPELGNLSNLNRLYLFDNQLSGPVPAELNLLTNMYRIRLNNNQLTDLPDLSSLVNLVAFRVANNHFEFDDLQNTGLYFLNISELEYAPQLELDAPSETISGNDIILSLSTSGTGDTYQWFKDWDLIDGETSSSLTISNSEIGVYFCEVYNSSYPLLILSSQLYYSNVEYSHGIIKEEYDALVAFYNSTQGTGWIENLNWLTDEDVENWYGVTIEKGHVISIYLNHNNLSGSIPSEIGLLTALTHLSLLDNQIGGSIPAELFDLVNLVELTFWVNQLTGTIPAGIEKLTLLEILDLSDNQLTGTIPEEIGSLSNLYSIYFNDNQLTGSIPSTLGNLTYLQNLYLLNNQLTGSIPPELGNLSNLNILLLNHNQLSGAIPPELGNLSNLLYLYLYSNQLSGIIPIELGNLSNLIYLAAHVNQLSGLIPSELGNLFDLQLLYLYGNQLSGPVGELNSVINLSDININDNQLTSLPDLSALLNLQLFIVANNHFEFNDLENTGLNFANISTVLYAPQLELDPPSETVSGSDIILSCYTTGTGDTYQWFKDEESMDGETATSLTISNSATGAYYCEVYNSIYPELALSTKLYFSNIDYSHGVFLEEYDALVALYNSTQGTGWSENSNWLSDEDVGDWYGLISEKGHVISITLPTNNLSGTIPPEIGDLSSLDQLRLEQNNISGTIPDELYNLTSLRELWLRENMLEGTISPDIQKLAKLEIMQLRTNKLSGTIPSEIGSITSLIGINLSQTALEGAVPSSFNDLTNLEHLYLYETNLSQLPVFSSMSSLINFHTNGSRFTFEDFITTALDFSSMSSVEYAPQDTLELFADGMKVHKGSSLTLNYQAITSEDLWSANNEFSMYRGTELIENWTSETAYVIPYFTSENEGKYTIRVRNSTYPELILYSDSLLITIQNQAPTDIALSNNAVDEDQPVGTEVGTFSTTDPDPGDTHTYAFVSGDGTNDADNSSFVIEGNVLKTAVDLNYEVKSEYFIFVETEDAGGLSYEKAFTVTVNDIVETGVEDLDALQLEVYPNPSDGRFTIRTSGKPSRIEVFNLTGQKVYEQMVNSEAFDLDLTRHPAGIYYLRINLEGSTDQTRLVVL